MKFSLKSVAAALVLAASAASASAAIENGANGNGELFFSAWDGQSSYNYDLNVSIDAFETNKNASGLLNLSYGSDFTSSFSSWLSTANTAGLQWSILATDTVGARRILSTVATTLPATNSSATTLRTTATAVQTYVTAVNGVLVGNSAVTTNTAASSYAGKVGSKVYNQFNFETAGTLAASSFDSGLTFQKTTVASAGGAAGVNAAYMDDGAAVRAWIGSDKTLHIGAVAAVPEPSEYALMLAGLGMIAAIARRRNKRA
jgi:hypothetical protein